MPAVVEVPAIAHTAHGDLRGIVEDGVAVWRGVAYAQQPVGERRFAAPAPLSPWTGVRDALEHGPLPPQSRSMVAGDRNDPKIRDEACLTATVWSPDLSGARPVMVWIPGGAFLNGAGQLQLYDGSGLAANGDVVVVNVTYRVGVFGGFELGSLGAGFDDNLGLRDQIAALAWVRDNIAAFGGDPDRVTVFGESAGATSVLALLASPAAAGLFVRAIAQSPALPLIADRETRTEQAQQFLALLGVTAGELKELPQRELRRAAGQFQLASVASSPTLAHGLTYGVDLLPQHPIDAARAGAIARMPLIIGTNRREAALFARDKPPMLPTTPESVERFLGHVAPDCPGPADGGLFGLSGPPRTGSFWCRRDVRRADVGVRRRLQRAGADLYVSVRPHTDDVAADRSRRGTRQRDRAHPAHLWLASGSTAASAGHVVDARGRAATAADVVGVRLGGRRER